MPKIKKFEFIHEEIKNIDELIYQLKSLKEDAFTNIPLDKIFKKDYIALSMIINFLKENKEVLIK